MFSEHTNYAAATTTITFHVIWLPGHITTNITSKIKKINTNNNINNNDYDGYDEDDDDDEQE